MNILITEEEREFLERICTRAELFAMKGLGQRPCESNLVSIRLLKKKLRALDANLINKAIDSDH